MFLVTSFSLYKEYICRISFSKFSDVLPTLTYARVVGTLWSICSGVNISSPPHWIDLYLESDAMTSNH